jgi:hypothetical protein
LYWISPFTRYRFPGTWYTYFVAAWNWCFVVWMNEATRFDGCVLNDRQVSAQAPPYPRPVSVV